MPRWSNRSTLPKSPYNCHCLGHIVSSCRRFRNPNKLRELTRKEHAMSALKNALDTSRLAEQHLLVCRACRMSFQVRQPTVDRSAYNHQSLPYSLKKAKQNLELHILILLKKLYRLQRRAWCTSHIKCNVRHKSTSKFPNPAWIHEFPMPRSKRLIDMLLNSAPRRRCWPDLQK